MGRNWSVQDTYRIAQLYPEIYRRLPKYLGRYPWIPLPRSLGGSNGVPRSGPVRCMLPATSPTDRCPQARRCTYGERGEMRRSLPDLPDLPALHSYPASDNKRSGSGLFARPASWLGTSTCLCRYRVYRSAPLMATMRLLCFLPSLSSSPSFFSNTTGVS